MCANRIELAGSDGKEVYNVRRQKVSKSVLTCTMPTALIITSRGYSWPKCANIAKSIIFAIPGLSVQGHRNFCRNLFGCAYLRACCSGHYSFQTEKVHANFWQESFCWTVFTQLVWKAKERFRVIPAILCGRQIRYME